MSAKPIFVATHPRACSTAFERVFMTRRDILTTVHEPFGDAYYFGPERIGSRYEDDKQARIESGFSDSTFKTIFDRIENEASEGKRVFIKDMAQYWIPPDNKPSSVAPSLVSYRRGVGTSNGTGEKPANGVKLPYDTEAEPGNPTVIPKDLLSRYHFAFLIRHPAYSIPSYYRCTIPPLDSVTGFYNFMPEEAGYLELRKLFDYLRSSGQVGPHSAADKQNGANGTNGTNGTKAGVEICLIDADDLLDNPSGIISAFCNSVGIEYNPQMLKWDNETDHAFAKEQFEKWKGFHEDAIDSTELKPRAHKKILKSDEELYKEWTEKYGKEGADVIQKTVAACLDDYHYLKQFAITV